MKWTRKVPLRRNGGLKGGPARARVLTAERRREIAHMGGRASAQQRLRCEREEAASA